MSNGGASSSCSAVLALAFATALGCITRAGQRSPTPRKKRHIDLSIWTIDFEILYETDNKDDEMVVEEVQDEVEKVRSLDGSVRTRSTRAANCSASPVHPSYKPVRSIFSTTLMVAVTCESL